MARGENATKAYISVGYSTRAATQCASRLRKKANVAARIAELSEQFAQAEIKYSIREQDQRIARAQRRWELMHEAIESRARNNRLRRRHQEIDLGLMAEARKHEEHAARELGQLNEGNITAIQAVINLPCVAGPQQAHLVQTGKR